MAIAFDAVSVGTTSSATSLTVSHTITGSNCLLLVHVLSNNDTDIITGVTYNGVSMTKLLTVTNTSATPRYAYAYGLLAPSSGANDIVASFSSASLISVQGCSYTGVKQTGLPDASASSALPDGGSSRNMTLTTVADNSWHWVGIRNDTIGTITAGGTMRENSPFTNRVSVADSNGAITPAGSHTITFTATIFEAYELQVSFAPSVAAGPANLKSYNTNILANIKSVDTNLIANVKSLNTNV